MIGKKIEEYEENMDNMTDEQIKEILDLFENMCDSFNKKENSISEAYCLAQIIFINHKFFKRGYDKLWKHINRIKTLIFPIEPKKYDWVDKVKQTIKEIEDNYEKITPYREDNKKIIKENNSITKEKDQSIINDIKNEFGILKSIDYKEKYKNLEIIGKGSFGTVYKGKIDEENIRALKIIDKEEMRNRLRIIYNRDYVEEEFKIYIDKI